MPDSTWNVIVRFWLNTDISLTFSRILRCSRFCNDHVLASLLHCACRWKNSENRPCSIWWIYRKWWNTRTSRYNSQIPNDYRVSHDVVYKQASFAVFLIVFRTSPYNTFHIMRLFAMTVYSEVRTVVGMMNRIPEVVNRPFSECCSPGYSFAFHTNTARRRPARQRRVSVYVFSICW